MCASEIALFDLEEFCDKQKKALLSNKSQIIGKNPLTSILYLRGTQNIRPSLLMSVCLSIFTIPLANQCIKYWKKGFIAKIYLLNRFEPLKWNMFL